VKNAISLSYERPDGAGSKTGPLVRMTDDHPYRNGNLDVRYVLERHGGRTKARTWDPMIKSLFSFITMA